jgi:hypothetical protein
MNIVYFVFYPILNPIHSSQMKIQIPQMNILYSTFTLPLIRSCPAHKRLLEYKVDLWRIIKKIVQIR